jgi:hypothetical protein
MAIRLIKDDEKLTKTIEGATFEYRRIPAHRRAKIVDANTAKRSGNVNWGKVSIVILQDSLLGWSGVIDDAGAEIPFDKALITYLPDTAQAELMELLGDNAELEGDIKNSRTSPASST